MAAESVTEVPADTDDRNITAASTEVPMDAAAMHSGQAEGKPPPIPKPLSKWAEPPVRREPALPDTSRGWQ